MDTALTASNTRWQLTLIKQPSNNTNRIVRFKEKFTTVCNCNHLSLKTQDSYWLWARKHIKRVGAKSANDLEQNSTAQFRNHISALANGDDGSGDPESYSGSTQNQAFHALKFLYEKVVGIQLGDLTGIPRATRHERFIEVPEHEVALKIVNGVSGRTGLCLRVIYSAALRACDGLRIRVKDLDFKNKTMFIQESKGGTARPVPMSESLAGELFQLTKERERIHEADLSKGLGWVHMPGRLAKKYPCQEKSIGWQFLFASNKPSIDPVTKNKGRHHLDYASLQRAFAESRMRCGCKRHYTVHGLRHACAQWWEKNGVQISTIQALLGHKNVKTTQRYVLSGKRGAPKVPTPI